MRAAVTLLWLLDAADVPVVRDGRFEHVTGSAARSGALLVDLLARGPVIAVVPDEAEGERALALGADEAVLLSELSAEGFDRVVSRTTARARARLQRDLFLIDLLRKDDTTAIELLAAALGEELAAPLARAAEQSRALVDQVDMGSGSSARSIAETVSSAASVVEKMRELVNPFPTDEVVDLAKVVREVCQMLTPAVGDTVTLALLVADVPCRVGLPRWQAVMMVARLVGNAVESASVRPEGVGTVTVVVSAENDAAILEVSDDGVGMDDDHRAYAADPFFTTTGKGHLGLGLTLVSSRVRRAGGSLIIESDPDQGTTVRVFLPLFRDGARYQEPN